jgi:hypothetical protein
MLATCAKRLTAVAMLAIGVTAAPASAQSLDDLYANAKGEGAFAFYVGGLRRPGKRAQKSSRTVTPASRSQLAAASPTCSTKKSINNSPPES